MSVKKSLLNKDAIKSVRGGKTTVRKTIFNK